MNDTLVPTCRRHLLGRHPAREHESADDWCEHEAVMKALDLARGFMRDQRAIVDVERCEKVS